jgi:hypothetical protein
MKVVIVGYGHYARDLIIPAYLRYDGIDVSIFGKRTWPAAVNEDYVFDVCVCPNDICEVVSWLAWCGAKKIILPKPIATNEKDYDWLISFSKRHALKIAVASQWAYDFTLIDAMKTAKSVKFLFRDRMFNRGYTIYDAFAPHVLHLCHMANIEPVAEYREMSDTTKERTVTIDGKDIDMTKRPDLFRPMITDFIQYFCFNSDIINSLDNYLPIARAFIRGRPI